MPTPQIEPDQAGEVRPAPAREIAPVLPRVPTKEIVRLPARDKPSRDALGARAPRAEQVAAKPEGTDASEATEEVLFSGRK